MEEISWATAQGEDKYGKWAEFKIRGVVQRLRWIEPGTFMMGSPEDDPGRWDDELQHEVTLSKGYWMFDTAVTQELWEAVMGSNPSFLKGPQRPVDSVNWHDCQKFIKKINKEIPCLNLSLPTEAQWEYACRAGTITPFSFGKNISTDQANYNGNYPYADGEKGEYREETVDVKALPCNDCGLYQMHGNVWEWCQDWFDDYSVGSVIDPVGPSDGSYRVVRGGSWYFNGGSVRSAYRNRSSPGRRYRHGFRLARVHD